jgi:hypothetical protein
MHTPLAAFQGGVCSDTALKADPKSETPGIPAQTLTLYSPQFRTISRFCVLNFRAVLGIVFRRLDQARSGLPKSQCCRHDELAKVGTRPIEAGSQGQFQHVPSLVRDDNRIDKASSRRVPRIELLFVVFAYLVHLSP